MVNFAIISVFVLSFVVSALQLIYMTWTNDPELDDFFDRG